MSGCRISAASAMRCGFRGRGISSRAAVHLRSSYITSFSSQSGGGDYDTQDITMISIPEYAPKDSQETIVKKRARLTWQGRKRGIKENCLIFSTFADKRLGSFSMEQLNMYDDLLNKADNDWETYYWMIGAKEVPKQFDNEIMKLLQVHCKNEERAERFEQPALNYEPVEKM